MNRSAGKSGCIGKISLGPQAANWILWNACEMEFESASYSSVKRLKTF